MDRGIVGALGQRQARQVLPADPGGAQTPRHGAVEVARDVTGHRTDSGTDKAGALMMAFFRKLQWLMMRRRKEAELHEELQFHVDEDAAERRAGGLAGD